MKYCIDYIRDSKILDEVDEININYDRIQDLNALLDFCNQHPKQRINVCFYDLDKALRENQLKDLLDFQKEHTELNMYIRLPGTNEETGVMLNAYPDCKFYFGIYVNDWDRVIGFINYGVTDIFIVEGLGFELEKIAPIAHEHKVQVRVFPNIAQSSWKDTDDLRKFWIRPEDIDFYEQYVDVCEFIDDNKKVDVLYDIYKNDKKWFGDLTEIIGGLTKTIDSRYIVPRFVKKRVRCGRECMKGGNCQMCDRIQELSGNLEKAGLIVMIDKEDEFDGERTDSEGGNNKEDIK